MPVLLQLLWIGLVLAYVVSTAPVIPRSASDEDEPTAWDRLGSTLRIFPFNEIKPEPATETPTAHHLSLMVVPGAGLKWNCTTDAGPYPLDCPYVFGAWDESPFSGDSGMVGLRGGTCMSLTNQTCEAILCAPFSDAVVDIGLAAARMMNPLQTVCVVTGSGGVWQDEEETMWVELRRSKEANNVEESD